MAQPMRSRPTKCPRRAAPSGGTPGSAPPPEVPGPHAKSVLPRAEPEARSLLNLMNRPRHPQAPIPTQTISPVPANRPCTRGESPSWFSPQSSRGIHPDKPRNSLALVNPSKSIVSAFYILVLSRFVLYYRPLRFTILDPLAMCFALAEPGSRRHSVCVIGTAPVCSPAPPLYWRPRWLIC